VRSVDIVARQIDADRRCGQLPTHGQR